MLDVAGGDDHWGNGDAGILHAHPHEFDRRGGHQGQRNAGIDQSRHEGSGAGNLCHPPCGLRDLLTSEALVDGVPLFIRQLRQEPPDRVEPGAAGGVGHDLVEALTHAVVAGEGGPHRLHDCRGVHQRAVHIAQKGLGAAQGRLPLGGPSR